MAGQVADDGIAVVVVALPAEISSRNAGDVYDQLAEAFRPGVSVIIADLMATSFCNSTGMRSLVRVDRQAVARGAQLRVVAMPGGPVWLAARVMGLVQLLSFYPDIEAASSAPLTPAEPEVALAESEADALYDRDR